MKSHPCGKGYTICLCFLIECPNYLNHQFCIVLLAALSCKKEFFLNNEIFYKISENYWWDNCPTGSDAPAHRDSETAVTHKDLERKPTITHEEEKIALILSLTGIFTIWYLFQ